MRFFKETESETTRSGRRLTKKDVRKRRRATRKKLAKIALGTALAGALAFSGYKTLKKMGSKKPDTVGKQLVVVPDPNPIKDMGKHFIPFKVVNKQLPVKVFGKRPAPLGKQLVVVPKPNPIKNMGKHFIPVKVLGKQVDTPLGEEGDRNVENNPAVNTTTRSAVSHAANKGSWGVTALEALHSLGNQIKGADTFIKKHAYQTLGRLSHQHYGKHSNVHRAEPSAEMARNQLREIVNDNLEAARNQHPMSAEQWDETVRHQLPEIVNDNVEAQLPMSAEQQHAMNAYHALLEPTEFYEQKFEHNKLLKAAKKSMFAREAASLGKSKDEYKNMLEALKKYSPEDLKFYDNYGGRRTRRARRT